MGQGGSPSCFYLEPSPIWNLLGIKTLFLNLKFRKLRVPPSSPPPPSPAGELQRPRWRPGARRWRSY